MSHGIMTLEQVSARTGVPVNTLRFYRASGRRGPKTFKLGGRVVALEDDVEAWISECYHAEDVRAPERAPMSGAAAVAIAGALTPGPAPAQLPAGR